MIRLRPRVPVTARDSMARGVIFSSSIHMATGMARISRSSTARVASGVTSRGERPVPPVVVFFADIAAAYYIAKLPRLVKGVLDVILTLPLVLPPTVVGYLLLRVLGPKRLIGTWVLETFGIRMVMTWWSAMTWGSATATAAASALWKTAFPAP